MTDDEIKATAQRARQLCSCPRCRERTYQQTETCLASEILRQLFCQHDAVDAEKGVHNDDEKGVHNVFLSKLLEGWCPYCHEQRMESEHDDSRPPAKAPYEWRIFTCEGCEYTCSTRVATR